MKLTLIAALFYGVAASSASASVISLQPSTLTPTVGNAFTIGLLLSSNADTLTGIGLNYSVTGTSIGFTGFTLNPGFDFDLSDPAANPKIAALASTPFTAGSLTLVSFSFLATQTGSSVFSVTSDINDPGPSQGLFVLTGTDFVPVTLDLTKQVTINVQAAATPEPATFGLGAMAMTGLFFVVRRRA